MGALTRDAASVSALRCRQLEVGVDGAPDGLGALPRRQSLGDRATAELAHDVTVGPHPGVAATELLLHAEPELAVLQDQAAEADTSPTASVVAIDEMVAICASAASSTSSSELTSRST